MIRAMLVFVMLWPALAWGQVTAIASVALSIVPLSSQAAGLVQASDDEAYRGLFDASRFRSVVGVGSDDTLNVRAGPNTSQAVMERFNNGELVVLTGAAPVKSGASNWVALCLEGCYSEGWVNEKYLAKIEYETVLNTSIPARAVCYRENWEMFSGSYQFNWPNKTVLYQDGDRSDRLNIWAANFIYKLSDLIKIEIKMTDEAGAIVDTIEFGDVEPWKLWECYPLEFHAVGIK
jgi:hypothetical protein